MHTVWANGVDLDVFYGDKAAWDKYAKATKSSKPASKPKPAGPKWVKETKTYTLKTAVKLRTGASTASSFIAVLPSRVNREDRPSYHSGRISVGASATIERIRLFGDWPS
ncbi:hypothetical protein [Lactiplantibacillus pentosus]|uniref:hypothetical protein n=1 Tax=Lactiplantibacillus pentosus TaxID=1589 RepID=UPI001FFCFCAF|nr:hypothetical protein [Lactiplantibacillus pentosus]